jgi:hypothetical protein
MIIHHRKNLRRAAWLAVVVTAGSFGTSAALAAGTTSATPSMQSDRVPNSLVTPFKPQLGLMGAASKTIKTPGPAGPSTSMVTTPTRYWIKRAQRGSKLRQ